MAFALFRHGVQALGENFMKVMGLVGADILDHRAGREKENFWGYYMQTQVYLELPTGDLKGCVSGRACVCGSNRININIRLTTIFLYAHNLL